MPAEHQRPDRQQQRLDPQQHGLHEADGVDDGQPKALLRTDLPRGDQFAVDGIIIPEK